MVKQLQKKFILAAMLAISLLLIVLIGGINIFNYLTVSRENDSLLGMLCNSYEETAFRPFPSQPDEPFIKDNDRHDEFGRPSRDMMKSARYFAAACDSNGNIISTDISHISSVTEEDAVFAAEAVFSSGNTNGSYNGYLYKTMQAKSGEGKIVIFLDNGMQANSILTVLIISVAAGIFGWLAMLLLIVLLSKKAIAPVAKSIEKQKQFVTNAGHEIKTPLAIILANTDAMELHNGENKWSKNIRAQTLRLSRLMQNLLMLAKMDESSAKLPMCIVSLSETVSQTAEAFTEPAALKGILIETDIKPDVSATANKESIVQLITTLMDNAVKYTESGSEIGVELFSDDKKAVLKISNTCDNIENPEKLFDRFYRGDSARTQKTGGYGIGLSVAQAIVQLHSGSITAHNENGRLVFTVKL